ncbi:MAG: inositol-3-phosphate synthase, partial [Candidatus Tectimicrobiota bacterium]
MSASTWNEIRTAIIGVGNCASSLVQGRFFYADPEAEIPGMLTMNFAGYRACDIRFVAAFDVDDRKVGRDLSEAIFAEPNCTTVFQPEIPYLDCLVEMGHVIDSIPDHNDMIPEGRRFRPGTNIYASEAEAQEAIVRSLRKKEVDVVINYLPVG